MYLQNRDEIRKVKKVGFERAILVDENVSLTFCRNLHIVQRVDIAKEIGEEV